MLVHLVLGGVVGLAAGAGSRYLADGGAWRWRPDLLSVVLAVGAGVALGAWLPVDADIPTAALRAALLLVLALVLASDVRERAVYPAIVYPATAGFVLAAPVVGTSIWDALFGAVVAGGLFGALYLVAGARYGPGALGEGDVSVAVLLGTVVGLSRLPLSLMLVGLFGAALAVIAAARARSLRASFAYAPALSLAALATLLIHTG